MLPTNRNVYKTYTMRTAAEARMCTGCESTESSGMSRRRILLGAGGVAAAVGLSACSTGGAGGAQAALPRTPEPAKMASEPKSPLELVLLGTQAGPPIEAERAGIASVLRVDGASYVVDCGRSAATQYVRAGIPLKSMDSIFLTHLHADHVMDYYNFFLGGGHIPSMEGDTLHGPITVYGPGPAGGLSPRFGGGESPTIAMDNPTPGTAEMTAKLHEAYAYSTNVFLRDMHIRDIREMIDVREIEIPAVGASFEQSSPRMRPFMVMRDDRVRVTATLVPHGPVFPSFAFRFDTRHGSVTFSGDTAVSDNLIELARDTDVLVHEAIGIHGENVTPAAKEHMLQSHVPVEEVGSVAQRARAKRLVLSHIAEVGASSLDLDKWQKWAQQGYDGTVVIGEDLQHFAVV